jgi:hypothetical protein
MRWLDPRDRRRVEIGSLAVVALSALVAALVAPRTPVGAVCGIALICASAALLAAGWPELQAASATPWGKRAGDALAMGLVTYATWKLFAAPIMDGAAGWPADFGPHHANIAVLVDSLVKDGHVPRWTHLVGTGDAPFDLYPFPTYFLTALVTIIARARDHIGVVIAVLGVLAHLAVGLAITRLALRMAPWPVAALAGLFWVTDGGSVFSGGALAVVRFGMSHQLTAQAFVMWALVLGVDTVRQRSLPRSMGVWALAAIGSAAHPLGLATTLGLVAGLGLSAALAKDASPRRLGALARDLAIGAGLAAAHWIPYTARVTAYGVHYGNSVVPAWETAEQILKSIVPLESFPLVASALFAGTIAGLVSRRWLPTLLASAGVLLFIPYTDWPFLVPGLAPSRWSARWPAYRAAGLAKPLLCAVSAYALSLLVHARAWTSAQRWSARQRAVFGAGLAVLGLLAVRGLAPVARDHERMFKLQALAEDVQDRAGWFELLRWAKTTAPRARAPERFGRLLFLTGGERQFPIYHLVAEAGMPTDTVGIVPGVLYRERLDSMSAADLRRWNVRWVATQGEELTLGDPATEQHFGAYRVRELRTWDGKVARVDVGPGRVITRRFDAERIELEVTGANASTLVVLGVPYYARWRATQNGRPLPVYGVHARSRSIARVLALRPGSGTVVLTCDGPLPSDGKGWGVFALALLGALAVVGASRAPRLADAANRLVRRGKDALLARSTPLVIGACVIVVALLAVRVAHDLDAEAMSVHPSTRLASDAAVIAREGSGDWRRCPYVPLAGTYECGLLGRVYGSMPQLLVDGTASWPFSVPATTVRPFKDGVTFRVTMRRKTRGKFESVAWGRGARVTLEIDAAPPMHIGPQQRTFDVGPEERLRTFTVEIEPHNALTSFGFVRQEALDLDRETDVPAPP